MKFKKVMQEAALNTVGNGANAATIENPTLNTFVQQITDLKKQMASATDPKKKIELQKQIQTLTMQMNQKKQEQTKALANKQKELQQANVAG